MSNYITLGSAAIGSIEPRPDQQARLDEITKRLQTDEFYVKTTESIPRKCIDGRSPKAGFTDFAPNAAGGTETLLIADELTQQRFHDGDDDTSDDFARLIDFLHSKGYQCGGHTDDHAGGDTSGCGANDKLPVIMQFLAGHGTVVRAAAEALGVSVDAADHERITARARQLVGENRYANGARMLATLRKKTHDAAIDPLVGRHNEVIAVINTKQHTTLDRNALMKEFGETYEAFNVDVWSFPEAARQIAQHEGAPALELAMVYYNLATAYVLGGANLRIIIR